MSTRAAAVAGYFYEADAGRLQYHVNQLLADSANTESTNPGVLPDALIVPHAGYIYSGSTAATAFRCLLTDPDQVNRVLLIVHSFPIGTHSISFFVCPDVCRELVSRFQRKRSRDN